MRDIPQHKRTLSGNVVKVGYPSFANQLQTQEEQKCISGYVLYWFILITSVTFHTVICMNARLLQSSDSGSMYRLFFFLIYEEEDQREIAWPFCSPLNAPLGPE